MWQADRGWPLVEFSGTLRNYGQALFAAPFQLLFLGVVSILLAFPGLLWLLRDDSARQYRSLGIAFLVILALVMLTGGKPYYAAVFGPALIAAGAVAVTEHSAARSLPLIIVATGLILVPISTPLLPMGTLDVVRRVNPDMAEMVGWPELVDDVAAVYDRHAGATILTRNYSEAGSIEVLGAARGLPQPISGHNTYWYWGHPSGRSPVTIAVGFPRVALDRWFGDCELARTFHSPGGVHNEEDGAPIFVCRDQRADWDALWPELRRI
jgi:hypothetical protein